MYLSCICLPAVRLTACLCRSRSLHVRDVAIRVRNRKGSEVRVSADACPTSSAVDCHRVPLPPKPEAPSATEGRVVVAELVAWRHHCMHTGMVPRMKLEFSRTTGSSKTVKLASNTHSIHDNTACDQLLHTYSQYSWHLLHPALHICVQLHYS